MNDPTALCATCSCGTAVAARRVPGWGQKPSRLVLVGEAPGGQELREGRPFVGPSGRLLDRVLAQLGYDRSRTYITNAVTCRDATNITTPTWTDIVACRPRLLEEVRQALAPGGVVVALGNVAFSALLGDPKAKVSKASRMVYAEGMPVVGALHPAAVLRKPSAVDELRVPLKYALDYCTGHNSVVGLPSENRYRVVESQDDVDEAVRTILDAQEAIIADIETSGLRVDQDEILCLCVRVLHGSHTYIFPDTTLRQYTQTIKRMFDSRAPWVWHHGKFDTRFLRRAGFDNAHVDHDTMLLHYALDENPPHGLKELSHHFLGVGDYESAMLKHLQSRNDDWRKVPRAALYQYASMDCICTEGLYKLSYPQVMNNAKLRGLYQNLLLPFTRFLQRVEDTGMWVDEAARRRLVDELTQEIHQAAVELQSAAAPLWDPHAYQLAVGVRTAPAEFNSRSPKQLAYLLYDVLGFKAPRGYGERTTEADVLDKFLAMCREDEVSTRLLTALKRYRKAQKLLSAYAEGIKPLIHSDGRVHQQYLVHGTVTGRLASREPNVQNIPREARVRNIFAAPPGRKLVEVDFKQAELRVLAWLSGDEGLKATFRSGRDLHDETARRLFGDNFTKEQRVRAKMVNFGIPYGRSAESLVAEYGMSYKEAQELVQGWLNSYPAARDFLLEQERLAVAGAPLVTPFGRHRRFKLITDRTATTVGNEARNFKISSISSDVTVLSALYLSERGLLPPGWVVINLVHDSILFEAPAEASDEECRGVRSLVEQAAQHILRPDFPYEAEVKVGQSWGALTAL